MKKTIGLACLLYCLPFYSQDARNCKDHKLFTRMTNYVIGSCEEKLSNIEFLVAPDKRRTMHGNVSSLTYAYDRQKGSKIPSINQVMKNYENAVLSKGGKKVFSSTMGKEISATYSIVSQGKEYWLTVRDFHAASGEVERFVFIVLENEPMKQEMQAGEMFDELNKSGRVALDVDFESGKPAIKPESIRTVDQVAQMLKENATLKIMIEGYADDAGDVALNKALSESRAQAVMEALISRGTESSRLTAKGGGSMADSLTANVRNKMRSIALLKQ
jgi:OmpA-OmpF porin, OOP family